MLSVNYGPKNMPKLVYSASGKASERTTHKIAAIDSSAIYLGSFVSITDSASASVAYGCRPFTAADAVYGVAVGFYKQGGEVPVIDQPNQKGTITNATGIFPMKYTFSASNDRSNATPDMELVEILPVMPGDIWEISLVDNAGTAAGTRGTTTGSDVEGYALGINTTSPFALNETTSSLTMTGLNFVTTNLNGYLPSRTDRVYVQPINCFGAFYVSPT